MKLLKKITYLFIATLLLASCSSDDDNVNNEPLGDYENGVLVTNEGPFGTGTGTVSFISNETNEVENNIYQNVNGQELGNIVQSLYKENNLAYIIVNNSHKIEVVNRYTFESIATIEEGLNNPRYFVAVGSTGYVTNWGDPFDNTDDYVAVIDLSTYEVISTIPVGYGPEKILKYNAVSETKIIVLHQGGYDYNNIISVIDTDSKTVETIIEVGDAPNSFFYHDNKLLLMCGGKPEFSGEETAGSLFEINLEDYSTSIKEEFDLDEHPSNLVAEISNYSLIMYLLDGNIYYHFGYGSTDYSIEITEGSFYSLAFNYKSMFLYASDAGDFNSNGEIKIFSPLGGSTSEINNFSVGIIPGGIYFNN